MRVQVPALEVVCRHRLDEMGVLTGELSRGAQGVTTEALGATAEQEGDGKRDERDERRSNEAHLETISHAAPHG